MENLDKTEKSKIYTVEIPGREGYPKVFRRNNTISKEDWEELRREEFDDDRFAMKALNVGQAFGQYFCKNFGGHGRDVCLTGHERSASKGRWIGTNYWKRIVEPRTTRRGLAG